MRLFFAITLPHPSAEALAAGTSAMPGVRWVPPSQMHFTLKFLGEIANERVPGIVEAVGGAVSEAQSFDARLGDVGSFKNPRETVIWIGVEHGSEAMAALARQIDLALEEIGIPRESRRFVPHLTVARVKNPALAPRAITDAKSRWGTQKGVDKYCLFVIDSFVMMQSELHSSGPIYTEMERFHLNADSTVARPSTAGSELT
jgi:2'-5' RNA ligase